MADPPLDRSVADLLAFHAKRYSDIKSEYEELKAQLSSDPVPPAQPIELSIVSEFLEKQYNEERESEKRLQDLVNTFGCRARVEEYRSRRGAAEIEVERMNKYLDNISAENKRLRNMIVNTTQFQTRVLAVDIRTRRREEIERLYPSMNYVQDSFVPQPVYFKEWPAAVFKTLYPLLANSVYVCLLPSPPATFPLSIPRAAQSSYCFHPFWSHPPGVPFEFIVEGLPGEWIYLGKYSTSWIPGYDMTLSEWLSLGEDIKSIYVQRIAAGWCETPPIGTENPHPNRLSQRPQLADIRAQYDCGLLKVPCYALQCLGFNVEFYHALPAIMKSAELLNAHVAQTQVQLPPPAPLAPLPATPAPTASRPPLPRSISNPSPGIPPDSLLLAPVTKRSILALGEGEDAVDKSNTESRKKRKQTKQKRGVSNPEQGKVK